MSELPVNDEITLLELRHMDILHSKLDIDAASKITELHQSIRQAVEEQIGDQWRVTRVREKSTTKYECTLATRVFADVKPEYIFAEALAMFEIKAVENTSKNVMFIYAQLMSDGKLLITNTRMEEDGCQQH